MQTRHPLTQTIQSTPTQTDWIDFNFIQILTSHQTNFKPSRANNYKFGNNNLVTILIIINELSLMKWLL